MVVEEVAEQIALTAVPAQSADGQSWLHIRLSEPGSCRSAHWSDLSLTDLYM